MAIADDTAITKRYIPGIDPGPPETERPGFWDETLPAAFRMENTVGSMRANGVTADWTVGDPDFDPFATLREEDRDQVRRFAYADTPGDVAEIQAQIDREGQDRATLAQSGVWGLVASLAAGVLDPVNLIPVGGATRATFKIGRIGVGAGSARGAVSVGSAGFVGATTSEAFLQSTQVSRTIEESLINVAAGTLLSGILGGAVGGLVGRRSFADLVREVDYDLAMRPPGGAVGAATPRTLDAATEAKIRAGIDKMVRNGELDDADAAFELARAQTREVLGREGIETNMAVSAVLKVVGRQDATIRLLQSPSVEVRGLAQRMFESPLALGKNQHGDASPLNVQARVREHESKLVRAIKQSEDAFVQYVKGRAKSFGSVTKIAAEQLLGSTGKLTHRQFREFTGQAMRRNDDATGIAGVPDEAIPHINRAAKAWRKEVFEPLKDEAIALGLLPEGVDVDTALSYLTRMYHPGRMVAGRQSFIDTTKGWLSRRQGTARERAAGFAAEEAAIKADIAALRSELRSLQKAVKEGTQEGSTKATAEAVDKALERFEADLTARAEAILLETPSAGKAGKASTAAFRRAFIKRLVEDVREGVLDAVDENATKILDDIARQIDEADGPDALALIRDQLARAGDDIAGDAGARAAGGSLSDATAEGFIAAQKAFERSLANQAKKLRELADDPAALTKAAADRELAAITKNIRDTAVSEARKAVRKATVETRKSLSEAVSKLAAIRKLNARDIKESSMTDDELLSLAEEIYNRVKGTPAGRLPYDVNPQKINSSGAAGGASALKSRVFNIEDELIEAFLESDIEAVGRAYIRSMAPDLEMVRAFGDIEMTAQFKQIQDAYDTLMRAPGADITKLTKAMEKDLKDLKTIQDRLLNRQGLPDDPMAWTYRSSRFVRQLNYTRMLGGMTVSAIPDMARSISVHGLRNTLRDGFLPLITNWSNFRKFSGELEDAGIVAEIINNTRMRALAGVQDDMARGTKLERGMGAISDTFGMVSLMAPWNQFFKTVASAVAMGRLTRAMRADIAGTITKKELTFLRGNYVDEGMSARIMAELDAADAARPGELAMPGEAKWGDRDAYRTLQAALNRDVDKQIVTPGMDRPSMSDSSEWGRHLFQFKSFAIAATQRMLLAGLQQRDLAALNGFVLSVFLGMLTTRVKMWDSGRGDEVKDWGVDKWLAEGVDRSGVFGWLNEVNSIAEKVSRGNVGLSAMVGGEQNSRYQSRNAASAVFGPTFGTAISALDALGNTADSVLGGEPISQSDIHAIRKLAPYQNLLGLRQLFDRFETGLGELAGSAPSQSDVQRMTVERDQGNPGAIPVPEGGKPPANDGVLRAPQENVRYQLERFANVELEADLQDFLKKDPIAALGFDPDRLVAPIFTGRDGKLNKNLNEITTDGDGRQFVTLGMQQRQGVPEIAAKDIARTRPDIKGDVIVTTPAATEKGTTKSTIVHESRHRGLDILREAGVKVYQYLGRSSFKDEEDFVSAMDDLIAGKTTDRAEAAGRLLDEITADKNFPDTDYKRLP